MANSKAIGVAYKDQAIEGGTIDNTPIGATTASTGAFTTLSSTGDTAIGNAATDLIAFHGATAVDQAGFVATVSYTFIEGSVSASALVGFSRGQVSNLLTLVNSMQALLVEKGLMAAS
jgi:hypothetical protein